MKSRKNAQKKAKENLEHLGKQEKYLFGLNGSFRRDNDRIQQESIMRKQQQGMMVSTREEA